MDGNVDPEGIRLDLEWLHRVGVRGVQMFDGGMGTPLVVPERVRHGSPEWQEAVRYAAATAQQLGLEFTVATSAGWSAAGGPWVEPADAMKKVVWSETWCAAAPRSSSSSRRCPTSPARTRTARGGVPTRPAHRFAQDWVAVACPAGQIAAPAHPGDRRGLGADRRLGRAGRR